MSFSLYFAVGTNPEILTETFQDWDWENSPLDCLVAYPALHYWDKSQSRLGVRWKTGKTILDSGAYSAWNSGKVIDIEELIKEAKTGKWNQVAALDVIGDAEKSLENAFIMKNRGLQVIPVFHYSEPWDILLEYKKHFPYIGMGGTAAIITPMKRRWIEQCFARVYPHRIHLFGCAQEKVLRDFPFTSSDTATWLSSVRYGRLFSMPDLKVPRKSVAGRSVYDLKVEVLHYLRMAKRIRERWETELDRMEKENYPTSTPEISVY